MTGINRNVLARPRTRRGFLRNLTACTATLTFASGTAAWARPLLPPKRALAFRSLHTGEELQAAYFREGEAVPAELVKINHILRDWRTGEAHRIDLRLLDLLYALGRELDSTAPFEVISAYRSPKTNAQLAAKSNGVAKRSMHMRGMAIDIHLPGRRLQDLHRAALGLKAGGVGLYSRSGFVHIDIGRVRRWGS